MELLRGGQIDEYHLYLYGKTNNDFRRANNANTPRYYWERMDFGSLSFSFYEKVKAAIESMFEVRGLNKLLIFEAKTVHDEEPYLYLVKYGDEIPGDIINILLPIEVENLGESGNPSLSQLAVVVTRGEGRAVHFEYDPVVLDIQSGISVPPATVPAPVPAQMPANNNQYYITNYGASQRRARTRRHRKACRSTRRHRKARRS